VSRLPRPRAKEVVRALERAGFRVIRVKGSHHIMKHADGRTVVVPQHAGEVIGPGLIREILKQTELSAEEFVNLL
jgi:predicted RNA binding protein YcfA (HicA-like mRNA interferase family)